MHWMEDICPAGTAGDVMKEPGDSAVGAESGTVRSAAGANQNRLGARGKGGTADGGEATAKQTGQIPGDHGGDPVGSGNFPKPGGDDRADPVLSGVAPEDGESEL